MCRDLELKAVVKIPIKMGNSDNFYYVFTASRGAESSAKTFN